MVHRLVEVRGYRVSFDEEERRLRRFGGRLSDRYSWDAPSGEEFEAKVKAKVKMTIRRKQRTGRHRRQPSFQPKNLELSFKLGHIMVTYLPHGWALHGIKKTFRETTHCHPCHRCHC